MIRSIVAAVVAVCALSAANAGEEELYLGFGLGGAELALGNRDGDTEYAEVVAGVQINKVASVEVSYQHFNDFDVNGTKFTAKAVNLALIGEKSLDERLGLIGRVYAQLADLRATRNDITATENRSDLGFGLGLSYKLGEQKNNTLRVEYRTVDPGADGDQHLYGLTLVHYFD
jgi:hypothetical protein